MSFITIQVSQEDIDEGKPRNCSICPVALAVNRHLKPCYVSEVDPYDITIYECNERGTAMTCKFIPRPREVNRFINEFDTLKTGKPFSFQIDTDKLYPDCWLSEAEVMREVVG